MVPLARAQYIRRSIAHAILSPYRIHRKSSNSVQLYTKIARLEGGLLVLQASDAGIAAPQTPGQAFSPRYPPASGPRFLAQSEGVMHQLPGDTCPLAILRSLLCLTPRLATLDIVQQPSPPHFLPQALSLLLLKHCYWLCNHLCGCKSEFQAEEQMYTVSTWN